jgi:hypothetical protein
MKSLKNTLMTIFKPSKLLIFLVCLSGCRRSGLPEISRPTNVKNSSFFDILPSGKPASYLYAPGLMGSEIIMGRYCPQFVASTGERVSWKAGGHVIGQPHTAVVFPEIDLKKKRFTLNPLKAFFNRVLRDVFPLAERFFGEKYGIEVTGDSALTETVANYNFNLSRTNIAQRDDINALRKAYAAHARAYPDTDVVLYGDSRGAATVFNFIALENPKRVKAAVIEGVFDAVPHALKHFIYTDKEMCTEERLDKILSTVMRKYNRKAPTPLDYAKRMHFDIPLLMVTSLNDWIVSPQCTFNLYKRLKELGHRSVHLLVLKYPSHPGYMLDDPAEKDVYESVVHAFYKKYGLPHNQERANAGEAAFALTQPTINELQKTYTPACCKMCF